jgi:hypothetical protein
MPYCSLLARSRHAAPPFFSEHNQFKPPFKAQNDYSHNFSSMLALIKALNKLRESLSSSPISKKPLTVSLLDDFYQFQQSRLAPVMVLHRSSRTRQGVKRQLIRISLDSPDTYPPFPLRKTGASSRVEASIVIIEDVLPVSNRTFSLSVWAILNYFPEGVSKK